MCSALEHLISSCGAIWEDHGVFSRQSLDEGVHHRVGVNLDFMP